MAEQEIRIRPNQRGGPAAFLLGGAILLFFPAGAVSFSGGLFPSQAFFLTAAGLLALCALLFLRLSRKNFPVLIRLVPGSRELQVIAADGGHGAISFERISSVTVERTRRSRYSVGLNLDDASFFFLDSFLTLRSALRFQRTVEQLTAGRNRKKRRDTRSIADRTEEHKITRLQRGNARIYFWSDKLTARGALYLNGLWPAFALTGAGFVRALGGTPEDLWFLFAGAIVIQIPLLVYGLRLRRLFRFIRITGDAIAGGRIVAREFTGETGGVRETARPLREIAAVLLSFEQEGGFSRILLPDSVELRALRELRQGSNPSGRVIRLLRVKSRIFALPLLGLGCDGAIHLREILERELKIQG